jgi:hypothetical protein
MVLHRMHPIPSIRALAERVNEKMYALNQGRMWMGGHMRRGDCKPVITLPLLSKILTSFPT